MQMVIGGARMLASNAFSPTTTISTQIVMDMQNAMPGTPASDALYAMSLVLLVALLGRRPRHPRDQRAAGRLNAIAAARSSSCTRERATGPSGSSSWRDRRLRPRARGAATSSLSCSSSCAAGGASSRSRRTRRRSRGSRGGADALRPRRDALRCHRVGGRRRRRSASSRRSTRAWGAARAASWSSRQRSSARSSFATTCPRFLIGLPSETHAGGGIGPEIFNTLYFAVLSTAVTLPVGVGAAVYIARFARSRPFVSAVRDGARHARVAAEHRLRPLRLPRLRRRR